MMKSRFYALVVVAVFCTLGIFILDESNILKPLQLKAYDAMFYVKAKTEKKQQKTNIAIIEIDDRTFEDKAFKIPQILWHNYFHDVIKGLADGGAKVIGLDYLLPREIFDDIVPNYSRVWLRTFAYARQKGIPLVTGFIEMGDQQVLPLDRYLQIIGLENIGYFNLTTDDDDFIRRQRLFFTTKEEDKKIKSFSYLVGSKFQPGLSPPGDTIYIDYAYPPPNFHQYSFSNIYQHALDNDFMFFKKEFQDKIVLIGETDLLTQDRHPTPLYFLSDGNSQRTPGIEIMAHTISTLLRGSFFSETPPFYKFIIYLVLSIITVLYTINYFRNNIYLTSLITALFLSIYGATAAVLFTNYIILPIISGFGCIILSHACSFSYRHYIVDKEKRKVKAVFQRYLPPKVIAQLLTIEDADFFRGQEKRLCILFSDIRSFTKYSENKSPKEVVSRLNEYFEAMSSIIYSEGGIVDKFLGDGIMAFFGAFDEDNSSSLAGCRAALKMLDSLEQLNQKWAQQNQETFKIGIGIHTGEVKVGNIGSHSKTEYTIIGDAVNLASRLQDKTKVLKEFIIISEDVYKDLEGEFKTIDKGIEEIRGRSPIRIYGLKGENHE